MALIPNYTLMKTVKLILALVLVGTFSQIRAQDRYLETDEFPSEITSYIDTHFPESDIISIKEEKERRKTEYEVKLRNMEELEFDQDYAIKSVESKSGLPESVVPQLIRDYVTKNYPNRTIKEWKKKRKGQEIELDNDLEIKFDQDGNFIRLDD